LVADGLPEAQAVAASAVTANIRIHLLVLIVLTQQTLRQAISYRPAKTKPVNAPRGSD
jgi:hypothetical protein